MKHNDTNKLTRAAMLLFVALFSLTGARADDVTIGSFDSQKTDYYAPIGTLYNYSFTEQLYTADEIGTAGSIQSISFYYVQEEAKDFPIKVYMKNVDEENLSAFISIVDDDLVFDGTLSVTGAGWATINLDTPFAYDGESNLLIAINKDYVQWFSGASWMYTSASNMARYIQNDNNAYAPTSGLPGGGTAIEYRPYIQIDITPSEAPAVARPTGLEVIYEGGTEATVRWISDEEAFDIEVNGEVTENVENGITLTGLELATTYTIRVRAKDGTEVSSWSSPVSFTTDLANDYCQIQLVLNDSYGDGWTGNAIRIVDVLSGIEIGTYTLTSGSTGTFIVEVPDERDIQFSWVSGSWSSECSYAAYDVNEIKIFSGSDALSEPVTYTVNCTIHPWRTPTSLTAQAGPTGAVLSWTENSLTPATSWVIAYMAEDDEDLSYALAESNPFTLEGLTPETVYYAMVSPYNEDEIQVWSDAIMFTTPSYADAKPIDLSVKLNPTTADVSWKGFAESYDIEWAEAESVSSAALQYDNGTLKSQVGNSAPSMWTWGVMYPSEMLKGNTALTKVAFYEAENSAYYYGNVTINIYSGGDTAPETLVGSETITTTGTNDMREVVLSTPIEIDPTQNLWITLTAAATYCLSMSEQDGGANSRWFLNDDTWVDFGTLYANGATYSFMIRGLVETINYSEWTSETNVTSPFTINGLDAETQYAVKVKGHYGSNGDSNWAMTFFTTPSGTEAPTDLAATDVKATSATLDWSGYQESYNVQYRAAAIDVDNVLFSEDFEGLSDGALPEGWTSIDNDGDGYNWASHTNTGTYNHTTHGGDGCMTSASYDNDSGVALTPDNWLITPQIALDGIMSAWFVGQDASYAAEHFAIYVSTTGIDVSDFTELVPESVATGDYVEYTADLTSYAGQQGYIAFRHFNVSDMFYLNLDDVTIKEAVPAGEWITVTATEAPLALTGLTPETEYEWQVQGILADGTTEWSELSSFTTTEQLYIVELADDAENTEVIENDLPGETVNVQLTGRTLYKDGSWNTICLPFSVTVADSPLAGATVYELDTENSSLTQTTLTLNFNEVTTIDAGKPYLIKWTSGDNITDPIFYDVTVDEEGWELQDVTVGNGAITFKGTYDPVTFTANDESILYVGANNKLYYPSAEVTMNAFRAYFQVDETSISKHIALKFGSDDATGISTVEAGDGSETIYNVAGQRLNKAQKGVNIVNGKKILK